jgi:curved DNA-binding protein CbpA
VEAREHASGHGSSARADDHYRLLQLDPDAPQQLIAEAYWFLASRLRVEQATRRSAERELAALNTAYQVLAVSEERRAYDATVPRIQELRRERAEKAQLQERASFPLSLFKKRPNLPVDYYELLRVDPAAGAPLIARAHSILRTLHSKEATGKPQRNYLQELAQARSVLLDRSRRAAYDESRIRASVALEALPAPEAKPDQKTTEVHLESPAGEPQVQQPREQTAEPGWPVREVLPAPEAKPDQKTTEVLLESPASEPQVRQPREQTAEPGWPMPEVLPAPEAKPDQKTTNVHFESPAGEPQVRQPREQTAEPGWQLPEVLPAPDAKPDQNTTEVHFESPAGEPQVRPPREKTAEPGWQVPEVLPAPDDKPDQMTSEVHLESPDGEPQVRPPREQTAEPRWRLRAASRAFKAIVAVAEGGTRISVVAVRLGYRGLLWTAKTGGKGLALAIKAAWRGSERLRRNRPLKQPPGQLPDDRLLRDIAPFSAKANRTERDRACLGRLVVRGPGGDQDAFGLGEEPVTLGRDLECAISLKTEADDVAPAHAQIWFSGERFIIRSLDPMHPTVLCGQTVSWASLDDGDEIEIGPYRLRFEAVAARDTPPDFLTTEQGAVANAEEIPERHE